MRLRDAGRLLHRVRHDDDGVAVLELVHQFLDARGGDRIERGTRLVHENDLRLDRNRTRDAEALLLAAGEPGSRIVEAVLHLVPQARLPKTVLDHLVEIGFGAGQTVNARSIGDIVVIDLGNGLGFWNTMPTRARSSTTSTSAE